MVWFDVRTRNILLTTSCACALVGCRSSESTSLDLDLIRVSTNAQLRTDMIGEGRFAEQATFVLVDAENTAEQGAFVTLGGELADASGNLLGKLKAQSLWVPSKQSRTFALVDVERKPRPTAAAASIKVRGALVSGGPPRVRVEQLHSFDESGARPQDRHVVIQGYVVNPADRILEVMIIAAFHDATGRPMSRPFSMAYLCPKSRHSVQFAGPNGSKRGTIFVGDVVDPYLDSKRPVERCRPNGPYPCCVGE